MLLNSEDWVDQPVKHKNKWFILKFLLILILTCLLFWRIDGP